MTAGPALAAELTHLLLAWDGKGTAAMSYIHKNLMEGEQVTYTTKRHWIIFLPALVYFLLGLALLIAALVLPSAQQDERVAWALDVFAGVAGLAAVWSVVPALIDSITSEFGVTNRRVIVKVGWLRRRSLETLLSKVEGIEVEQSILARVFGYGTITVTGTGGSREPFDRIAAPLEFRRKVQEQTLAAQGGR